MVSGAINAIWKKSGIVNYRVNATKFRRAAVTAIRERGKDLSFEAADLMGHMKSTADKVYHIRKKEKNSLQAAAHMGSLLRQQETMTNSQNTHDTCKSKEPEVTRYADESCSEKESKKPRYGDESCGGKECKKTSGKL